MSAALFLLFFAGAGFCLGSFASFGTREAHDDLPSGSVVLLVGVAAIGGAFSSADPTLLEPLDVALRALVAAAIALFACRARRSASFIAVTVVAVVVSIGAQRIVVPRLLLVAAGLAVGFALAAWVSPRSPRMLSALVALALSQLALRIPTAAPARLPSAAAAVGFVVVLMSGFRHGSPRLRRWTVRSSLAIGLLGMVATVAGGLTLLRARSLAENGVSSARQGIALARVGSRDEADLALAASASSLTEARRHLRAPIGQLGRAVPVVSQHLLKLDELSGLASDVVASARLTSGDADMASFKSEQGTVNLDEVRDLSLSLEATVRTLARAERTLAQPSEPWIVPQVAERVSSFRVEMLDADREASALLDLTRRLPAMLGGETERRYLLVLPTLAEARGSGGVIGNYGELTAVGGRLSLAKFGRQVELIGGDAISERTVTAPPDFLSRYGRFGLTTTWSNVNMSPDFEAVAAAMAELYPQSGGRDVDGVISADPFALQALLGVLGPLSIPGWPEPLNETNTARVLLHDAYVANPDAQDDRITLLSDVTTGVWEKISTAGVPNPRSLVERMAPVARHRNLQIWMRDPAEQNYITRVGLAGSLQADGGERFGVVVNNASANKIEYFLHRTIDYDVRINDSTSTVESTATIALRNDAPAEGLPDYVIGNFVRVDPPPRGTSLLYVSVYSTLRLSGLAIDGTPVPEREIERDTESGMNVYSTWVPIPARSTRTLEVTLTGKAPDAGGPYRARVFTQPMVNPDTLVIRAQRNGDAQTLRFEAGGPDAIEEFVLP